MANPKFLMPNTFKMSEVLTIIKKKLHLASGEPQGLILFAEGKHMLRMEDKIAEVFERYRDQEDGFLYIVYAAEQVYGGCSEA